MCCPHQGSPNATDGQRRRHRSDHGAHREAERRARGGRWHCSSRRHPNPASARASIWGRWAPGGHSARRHTDIKPALCHPVVGGPPRSRASCCSASIYATILGMQEIEWRRWSGSGSASCCAATGNQDQHWDGPGPHERHARGKRARRLAWARHLQTALAAPASVPHTAPWVGGARPWLWRPICAGAASYGVISTQPRPRLGRRQPHPGCAQRHRQGV